MIPNKIKITVDREEKDSFHHKFEHNDYRIHFLLESGVDVQIIDYSNDGKFLFADGDIHDYDLFVKFASKNKMNYQTFLNYNEL